ncbi:unnamed protein product, partial [Gongylonema pulchrum]|uniref:IF rod domain-containing protein n=1 Tax=Gongylonema pulchrum TaxID=637853 RepID=A0A183CYZ0_9BILA
MIDEMIQNLLAESEELKPKLEIVRKRLEDKIQLKEIHRKHQVEKMTTAREMERAYKSRLQEQLQAMRAGFDARLNENRRDIDEKYKNKLDEANEALQQMNQAQEETARMRLRVNELEKTGSGYESRTEALNRKIADFESQLRLTRDDYDLRLSQRDKRVVELQEEIGRLLNENQDKFDLGVQLNTELKAYQESRLSISRQPPAASPAAPGDRSLNVLSAYFGWLRAITSNSDCDIEIEEHDVDGKFIKL